MDFYSLFRLRVLAARSSSEFYTIGRDAHKRMHALKIWSNKCSDQTSMHVCSHFVIEIQKINEWIWLIRSVGRSAGRPVGSRKLTVHLGSIPLIAGII